MNRKMLYATLFLLTLTVRTTYAGDLLDGGPMIDTLPTKIWSTRPPTGARAILLPVKAMKQTRAPQMSSIGESQGKLIGLKTA